MKKSFIALMVLFIALQSCGVLIHREMNCKEHIIKPEKFWFQGIMMNEIYVLTNKKTEEKKEFYIVDKWISHRKKYYSDTGCDCHDRASQLLISDNDSIWTQADYRYVEKKDPKFDDVFTIKFGDTKWIFSTVTSTVTKSVQEINGKEIPIKIYQENFNEKVYKLIVGEGVGIISIQLGDDVWERETIVVELLSPIEEYRIMFSTCH